MLELRESPCCVHDLVDALAVPQPLVSQHLRVLKAAGVVHGERRGREVVYSLVDDHLAHIVVDAVAHAEERERAASSPPWRDATSERGERVTTARAMRATRQRAAVSGLLDRLADFRSAQEIHEELRRVGEGIGLTTVYRTLQALADAGEVDVLRTGSGESVYRRCATDDHHHHLVCRQCGKAVEIAGPAVETWAQRVADEHGYTDLSHTVEIFGLCRECGRFRGPSQNESSGAATEG